MNEITTVVLHFQGLQRECGLCKTATAKACKVLGPGGLSSQQVLICEVCVHKISASMGLACANEVAEAEEEIAKLKAENNRLRGAGQLQGWHEAMDGLRRDLANSRGLVTTLQESLHEASVDREGDCNNHRTQMNKLVERVGVHEHSVMVLRTECSNLKSSLAHKDDRIKELEAEIEGKRGEFGRGVEVGGKIYTTILDDVCPGDGLGPDRLRDYIARTKESHYYELKRRERTAHEKGVSEENARWLGSRAIGVVAGHGGKEIRADEREKANREIADWLRVHAHASEQVTRSVRRGLYTEKPTTVTLPPALAENIELLMNKAGGISKAGMFSVLEDVAILIAEAKKGQP